MGKELVTNHDSNVSSSSMPKANNAQYSQQHMQPQQSTQVQQHAQPHLLQYPQQQCFPKPPMVAYYGTLEQDQNGNHILIVKPQINNHVKVDLQRQQVCQNNYAQISHEQQPVKHSLLGSVVKSLNKFGKV